jgi:hypothetical protein
MGDICKGVANTLYRVARQKITKNTEDLYGENPIFQKNRHQDNVLRGGGHVHQEAAGEDD